MIESRTCLLPMITTATHQALRLFRHYKNGVLPHGGGLLDQPNHYIEAMQVLAERDAQLQAEIAERSRK